MAFGPTTNEVDIRYLYGYMCSRELGSMFTGSAQKHLDKNMFFDMKVPVPPLDVQVEIVQKLGAIEAQRQTLRHQRPGARRLVASVRRPDAGCAGAAGPGQQQ